MEGAETLLMDKLMKSRRCNRSCSEMREERKGRRPDSLSSPIVRVTLLADSADLIDAHVGRLPIRKWEIRAGKKKAAPLPELSLAERMNG